MGLRILPYSTHARWLAASESRLLTHVCVMSVLIVVMIILYNTNGLAWGEDSVPIKSSSEF